MTLLKGVGLLLCALAGFSLFSIKAPKGSLAMSGLANAAIASFLVEAVHRYIFGDLLNIPLCHLLGETAGSLSGVASGITVPLAMGANPVFAVATGLACGGFGILPGFLAGYVTGLISPVLSRHLPDGLDVIGGTLLIAPLARGLAIFFDPFLNATLLTIGGSISAAASQSPLVMGFILGGIMKMICTSPLSAMAITAMIGLNGLAMGIASIACVGGCFSDGLVFARLKLGDRSNVIAVMLEPLTQAEIVTRHPLPIYGSNFFGGALSGVAAAAFHIINNAPGTASPIPGLIAPFAFNAPENVFMALFCAISAGLLSGFVGSTLFKKKAGAPSPVPVES